MTIAAWFLVIYVYSGSAPAITQTGPFAAEVACKSAGERVVQELHAFGRIVAYSCIPTDLPPPRRQ